MFRVMEGLLSVFVLGHALVPPGPTREGVATDLFQFEQWLDARGVERAVLIQDDTSVGGGRGLVASRRLEPGEVAAVVPASVTLRLGGRLHDDNDDWAGIMAAKLMHENELGESSRLFHYLNSG